MVADHAARSRLHGATNGKWATMSTRRWFTVVAVMLLASAFPLLAPEFAPDAGANQLAQGTLVDDDPVAFTPNVLNGYVTSITTVGERVVVGGTFTSVGEVGTWVTYTRNYLFAFDRNTGLIDQAFVPALDGPVESVEPAPDGTSVFVGGSFANVNGVSNYGIAKLDLGTGAMSAGFNASTSGKVRDLAVNGNRVFIAGDMWRVNGETRKRLAAIDATTGALDPTLTVGTTLPRVSVDWIEKVSVNPAGTELVITGNFLQVEGLPREQIARIDLTGPQATVMPWTTQRFGNFCASAFWTYLKDVEYSLDGSYFVVATTGGPFGSTRLCDSASRWETSSQSPTSLESWANWTGGDTLTAVAISDVAVYIGGHQRWMNNHLGSNTAGPGAVVREGLAALDPANGVPLAWNPGKHRGIGVWDLHLSDRGMYVGSDTDFTAGEWHAKLAQFPLAGGNPVPVAIPDQVPTTLYTGSATTLSTRSFTGTTFGPDSTVPGSTISWTSISDAFLEAGKLYSIESDSLRSRTFDGDTFGPVVTEPSWTSWPNVTGATFHNGRIYYTQSNSTALRYRYFALESGIVGSQTFTVADGISWSNIAGMDVAGNRLYYARTDGNLWVVDLANGVPVNGTQQLLSGPATGDGKNWNTSALFFRTTDTSPTVSFVAPPAGSVVSGTVELIAAPIDDRGVTQVTFSAGATAIGTDANGADGWSVPWNTVAAADGPATVTVTVTDNGGQTGSATLDLTVDNLGPTVAIVEPTAGAVVAGTQPLTATASDIVGVAAVSFTVDATLIGTDTDGTDGWSVPWDTTTAAEGPATVTATATDTGGRPATANVPVTVDNIIDPPTPQVLMVVGNPTTLGIGEVATRDRLITNGYAVDIVDDNVATAADAADVAFVLVSSTVISNVVGAQFRDVAAPVWMAKPFLLDDMGMTGTAANVDYGTVSSATVSIATPTHPMAAGLAGTVVITTPTFDQSFGVPGPTARVITTAAGKPTTFVYRAGVTLASGLPAAGCRLTTPLFGNGPGSFTAEGWSLFEAAVDYVGAGCPLVDDPGPQTDVVLVVANPAGLGSGEVAVRDRLVGLGAVVTIVDDNAATAATATGAELVVVSSSVASSVVAATFRDVSAPVWMAKPFLLDDMGMTGVAANIDYGTTSASTVTINAPTHPMAAGLTGDVAVTTLAVEMSFGLPGTGATAVANVGTRSTSFVYRPGATLANATPAAGCRLMSSIFQSAPTAHTAEGWALFDAAAQYAIANCPAVP